MRPVATVDSHSGFTEHLPENTLADARFIKPGDGDVVAAHLVAFAYAEIEFEREAAGNVALADIGAGQAAGGHAAGVLAGFEERRFEAVAGAGYSGHDAGGGAAVDNEVIAGLGHQPRADGGQKKRCFQKIQKARRSPACMRRGSRALRMRPKLAFRLVAA
jgi:hypothetical protein